MNNYQLATADRFTHVRIVAVALVACIAIVGAGKAVRSEQPDTNARLEARTQMMVAGTPTLWTGAGHIIR